MRREFDKALDALAAGNRPAAAFYAGALHYLGDLGQFYLPISESPF